jgi:hypothetical protein
VRDFTLLVFQFCRFLRQGVLVRPHRRLDFFFSAPDSFFPEQVLWFALAPFFLGLQ